MVNFSSLNLGSWAFLKKIHRLRKRDEKEKRRKQEREGGREEFCSTTKHTFSSVAKERHYISEKQGQRGGSSLKVDGTEKQG